MMFPSLHTVFFSQPSANPKGRYFLLILIATGATMSFGWSKPPLCEKDKIEFALARGSAAEPSAVFPLTIPGEPIACWWDEKALHVGGDVIDFAAHNVMPTNGAVVKFELTPPNGKRLRFEAVLKEKACSYRVEDFGPYDNAKFGLAFSTVGEDVEKNDFFENLSGYGE